MSKFKREFPFDRRAEISSRLRQQHPDRVPIIVEKAKGSDIPEVDRKKFLVPADVNMGKFVFEIRKHMTLPPEKAIFLFVGNDNLVPVASPISSVYEKYKDPDGFLYVNVSGENTFG